MDVPERNVAKTICRMSLKRRPDHKNLGAMLAEEKHSDVRPTRVPSAPRGDADGQGGEGETHRASGAWRFQRECRKGPRGVCLKVEGSSCSRWSC